MHNNPGDFFALAGAAGAIFAAIGQAYVLPDSRQQNGFSVIYGEIASTGFDGDGKMGSNGNVGGHLLGILGADFQQVTILPLIQSPLGALPSRFRRERVLLVGCGDVGLRAASLLRGKVQLLALTSTASRQVELRSHGVQPIMGNLDHASTCQRLAGVATRVLHLAPPPSEGWSDPRTLALTRALRKRTLPLALVYGSTSGVYGDCAGAWIDETRAPRADTPRARRRLHAEQAVRFLGRSGGVRASTLRVPGIYAQDRDGGTPKPRLLKGTPVLVEPDDVYTNHIHADDLARACVAALWRGRAQRTYNINDDTVLKMGDYFDLAADLYGLARPPRVSRQGADTQLPLMLLSFMSESRRMVNLRMKAELGVRLRYPTVREGLA
jgi:nucleoside-diphosphate-sugar epimerase